ncbi:MAG: EamA family transporter [Deltaproteobacteria bacterium]|nr:EamA family transporter [Deltaproteobacteria bacterium]
MTTPAVSHYLALALSILIGIGGQLLLKGGALQKSVVFMFSPMSLMGLGAYFLAAMFYLYCLRAIPVSTAFPTVSISYVAVALLSHYLWKEPFGLQQVFALVLIIGGVMLLHYRG